MKAKLLLSITLVILLVGITFGAGVIKVGVLYPYNSETGNWIKNSVQMAADEINANGGILGSKIQLYFADVSGGAGQMISSIQQLVTLNHVDLLIGGVDSGSVLASLPFMAKYKILWLGTGGADISVSNAVKEHFDTYKYYFAVGTLNSVNQGTAIADFIVNYVKPKYNFTKFAIISNDLVYAHTISETAAKICQENGMQLVYSDYFPTGTSNFSGLFSKAIANGAQIIIDSIVTSDGIPFDKQWYTLKVPAVLIGANAMALDQGFYTQTGGQCLYVTDMYPNGGPAPLTKNTLDFVNKYYELWGSYPGFIAFPSYNALYVLKAAAESVNSLDTDTLINAIQKVEFTLGGDNGVTPEAFTEYHDLKYGGNYAVGPIFQWQPGGKYVCVWPEKYATGEWMLPDWINPAK